MSLIDPWVAPVPKREIVRQQIDLGRFGPEEVEVTVEHCGLCHSDVSVLNDE